MREYGRHEVFFMLHECLDCFDPASVLEQFFESSYDAATQSPFRPDPFEGFAIVTFGLLWVADGKFEFGCRQFDVRVLWKLQQVDRERRTRILLAIRANRNQGIRIRRVSVPRHL